MRVWPGPIGETQMAYVMHDTSVSDASGTRTGTNFPYLWVPVPLNGDAWAIVSPEDAPRVLALKWHTTCSNSGTLYARHAKKVAGKVQHTMLHRFVLGVIDPLVKIDHEDGDGLNCLRYNLRIATDRQNSQNKIHSKNRQNGKFKGVSWNVRAKKWEAGIRGGEIGPDGKRRRLYIGVFALPEDAARAYDAAALKYFGEFAALNFSA